MSEKLNKLGFFAGKLFTKTVNEVKPFLTNNEPPQPDLKPTLSPEEKIKKAIELLDSKKIGFNIELLLNRIKYESDEVISNQVINLNDELKKDFKIENIRNQFNFSYKENFLQILVIEKSISSFEHDLVIIYSNRCVLIDGIVKTFSTKYDYIHINFNQDTLKSFKNGSWMDDLEYLNKSFDEYERNQKKLEKDKQLKQLADKLDLNPLD